MPSLVSTAPIRTDQPCPPGSWDVHHHIFDLDKFPLAPTRHFTPSSAPLHSFETFQHSMGIDHACIAHGLSFGTDPSSLLYYLKYFNGSDTLLGYRRMPPFPGEPDKCLYATSFDFMFIV